MAKTYKAKVYLTTSSSTKTYTFAFDYINKRYIKGRLNDRELVWGTDYTVSGHSFTLVEPPPSNGTLEVYRQTPSGKAVEWYDGSILRAKDLNLHNIQMLHITEENYDYFQDHFMAKDDHDNKWEARELIIKNVQDPVNAGDALNKKYFEAVSTGYLQKMQAGVDESKRQAGESKKQAGISTTEANRSKSEADRAKDEADRAKRENDKRVEKVTQVVKEGVNTVNTTVRDATASINTTTRNTITTINDEKAEALKVIQQATEKAVSEANRSQKEADMDKTEADRAASYHGKVTTEVTKAIKDINNTVSTAQSAIDAKVTAVSQAMDSKVAGFDERTKKAEATITAKATEVVETAKRLGDDVRNAVQYEVHGEIEALKEDYTRKVNELKAIKGNSNAITVEYHHEGNKTAENTMRTFMFKDTSTGLTHMGGFFPDKIIKGIGTVVLIPPLPDIEGMAGVYYMDAKAISGRGSIENISLSMIVDDNGLIIIKGYPKGGQNMMGILWELVARAGV